MMMTHVVPVLKYELEIDNRSPGVLTSLFTCLSRSPLSTSNTETLCYLVNKALDCTKCSTQQALCAKVSKQYGTTHRQCNFRLEFPEKPCHRLINAIID